MDSNKLEQQIVILPDRVNVYTASGIWLIEIKATSISEAIKQLGNPKPRSAAGLAKAILEQGNSN